MGKLGPGSMFTLALGAVSVMVANVLYVAPTSWRDASHLAAWIVAQWIPSKSIRADLLVQSWSYWENVYGSRLGVGAQQLKIPEVDVQQHLQDLPVFLDTKFGMDWRKRPLLLRNLWSPRQLDDPERRLSVHGLLQETNLSIPYFTDARKKNALTPDATGTVADIVANITRDAKPHKIGTQLIVQRYPELISEIAPTKILTALFGDYFQPDHVKGMGPGQIFPALTTVPVFISSGVHLQAQKQEKEANQQSYTALHCEPIGNIAVQLSGAKQWTLVDPLFSFLIRPSTAPDGRAFFASWMNTDTDQWKIPTYTAITRAGDAMWVPTWTWHRVDYIPDKDIAIGGSLFHFRPKDFILNNPLFAFLMIPAMFLELVGYNTQ